MLAVLVHTDARLQSLANVLVLVNHGAVAIEYLDNSHIGKVGVWTLTLLLQGMFEAQYVFARWLSRVNTL